MEIKKKKRDSVENPNQLYCLSRVQVWIWDILRLKIQRVFMYFTLTDSTNYQRTSVMQFVMYINLHFFMLTFYVILGICWEFLDVSYKYILSVGINWWSSNWKLSQNENRYLCVQWSHKSRKKKNQQPSLYFTTKLRDSSLELISFINTWNSSSFDSKNIYSIK